MAAEEIEMLFQNAPVIIVEGVALICGHIFSSEMVLIDELLVPVIYKDFQMMFQFAVLLLFFAHLTSVSVLIIDYECTYTRVCRWLGIMFFGLALCILIVYANFSTDV